VFETLGGVELPAADYVRLRIPCDYRLRARAARRGAHVNDVCERRVGVRVNREVSSVSFLAFSTRDFISRGAALSL